MEDDPCPFCKRISEGDVAFSTLLAVAIPDAYPISLGHMLALTVELDRRLADELAFDGVNIGVNSGEAAGQTVAHAHLHFIPRYRGDVDEPAGGIRWLFPEKAGYWE